MSRRKRVSCWSTGRSMSYLQLLSQLNAIPVGVVHVEEPHLARQLEDDPDLDARVAQPVGLFLQVGDVDVRDALVARLALREPDLHLAAPELRPARVEVDGVLLEAEHVLVEAAPLVEVADVVPDRGRHGRESYSASPGSSRLSFRVWRKAAAGAPSTARWSNVQVRVTMGRTAVSPPTATTRSSVAPTATIAACGGVSTAVKLSTAYMPRFEIVKVPPSRSSARSFASRARPTRSARAPAISVSESRSAPRITGTTRPWGAETARPALALGWRRMASSVNSEFPSRWRMSACAQIFVRTSVTVMRTSGSRSRSLATRAFTRVMSAEAWSWKTGTCHASVRRRAIVLRMFESGIRSTSPVGAGAGATDGGAVGPPASARSTSSATIRPSGPVPGIP